MFDAFTVGMAGEGSKPPHGEGTSDDKKDEEKSSKGSGGKPPPSPPYSSSSSSPSASYSTSTTKTTHTHSKSTKGKTPLLKLDVKFELPMYNGEVNAERLDNWIRQLEVYCRIQKLQEDDIKIQLASLRMEGSTLVWWEARTQEEIKKYGNISMSWAGFISAIKMKLYPLAYMQKAIMDWKNFRQLKGKSVQDYTHEFRRRALILGINLYSQETLLNYIGVCTVTLGTLFSCSIPQT